jgi:hypothetical protein
MRQQQQLVEVPSSSRWVAIFQGFLLIFSFASQNYVVTAAAGSGRCAAPMQRLVSAHLPAFLNPSSSNPAAAADGAAAAAGGGWQVGGAFSGFSFLWFHLLLKIM